MKYIICIGIIIACLIIACKDDVHQSNLNYSNSFAAGIWGEEYYISGMHYAVQSNAEFGIIINITKDSLECAYYKQQLSKQ